MLSILLKCFLEIKKYQKYTNSLPINHKELNEILENFIAELPINNQPDLFIGEDLEILLEVADDFRSRWGSNQIEISHILIAIGRDNRLGEDLLYQAGLPSEILEAELRRLPAPKSFKQSKKKSRQTNNKSTTERFTVFYAYRNHCKRSKTRATSSSL